MSINDELKQAIRERAKYVCEYCHSPERLSANRFTVDHVIPKSLGGSDQLTNLALACRRCNERRYNFVAGIDPETQEIVPIFNPRQHKWAEHFVWLNQGVVIEGTTLIGRATCLRLDLNDTRYPEEDSIRETRRLLRSVRYVSRHACCRPMHSRLLDCFPSRLPIKSLQRRNKSYR